MSKKIDDYLDLKIKDEGFGISIERTFVFKITETFNKNEYARFEEEIKDMSRIKILREVMKLIAQEIEENGLETLEVTGEILKSMMFDIDTGKRLMVLDKKQLEDIRRMYNFGSFCAKQLKGEQQMLGRNLKEERKIFMAIKNSKIMEIMKEVYGMKTLEDFEQKGEQPADVFDKWFKYLIKDFVPSQGIEDMEVFAILQFNSYTYILWKLAKAGRLKGKYNEEMIKNVENVRKMFLKGGQSK